MSKKSANPSPPPGAERPDPPPAPPPGIEVSVDRANRETIEQYAAEIAELERLVEDARRERDDHLRSYQQQLSISEDLTRQLEQRKALREARDRQVVTATRLQLIQVVETWKRWREQNESSVDELIFRLRTKHVNLPDRMIVAKAESKK